MSVCRDQLREFRQNLAGEIGQQSTSSQLAQHKEWLRRFQSNHNLPFTTSIGANASFGPVLSAAGSDSGSVYPCIVPVCFPPLPLT